ncbi:MAG: hypothetical protein ABJA64_00590 [Candidatus Saccharibacteria bacterium]
MGKAASRSLDVTKEFLAQDLSTFHPDQFLRPLISKDLQKRESKAELKKVVERSHEILAQARTVVLPVNLFTDTVVVDRTKITITKRTFFWTAQVISIRIEDVLNVSTTVGPLFGSLTVSSRVMNSTDHFSTNYFWRRDAIALKRIIQGYVIALHNKIDIDHLGRRELVEVLNDLGQD